MDTDEVHVTGLRHILRRRRGRLASLYDEAQEEANHLRALFDDQCLIAELVKENRMRKGADGASPPMIDDFHDAIEIAFGDAAHVHRLTSLDKQRVSPLCSRGAIGNIRRQSPIWREDWTRMVAGA